VVQCVTLCPLDFTDISVTGTVIVNGDDDISSLLDLPFSLTLCNISYTTYSINTNGVIFLGGVGNNYYSNVAIPFSYTGPPFIAVYWDDLVGPTYAQTLGTAPNRVFVAQWTGIFYAGNAPVSCQVRFNEDGNTTYSYVEGDGSSATIGFYSDPTCWQQISFNTPFSVPSTFCLTNDFGEPVPSSVTPSHALPGGTVTIVGTTFGTVSTTVAINGNTASIVSWADTSIVVTVPSGTGISVSVDVTNSDSKTNNPNTLFSYDPIVTSVSPGTVVGTTVTIFGIDFGSSVGTVAIGSASASVVSWGNIAVAIRIPQGSGAGLSVYVTRAEDRATNAPNTLFSYCVIHSLGAIASASRTSVLLRVTGDISCPSVVEYRISLVGANTVRRNFPARLPDGTLVRAATWSGLRPNTVYHFSIVAVSTLGAAPAATVSVKTLP
jgi:hypothetical protein